jgi:hypothetical protein
LAGHFERALNFRPSTIYLTSVLGFRPFKVFPFEWSHSVIGISQLVIKSAYEDTLGMVQWDLGVLLNCLCMTLKTLDMYVRTSQDALRHTPQSFLQRKGFLFEQDTLATAIKLAIVDIVRTFGKDLNGMGLESEAADICQRAWDMEIL